MPSTTSLRDLPPGASCIVEAVTCERPIARRLMEMGLLPGTRVTITRIAPLGDPVEVRLRDFALSIRRAEAARVRVADVRVPEPTLARIPSYRAS